MDSFFLWLAKLVCKIDNFVILVMAIGNFFIWGKIWLKKKKINGEIHPASDKTYNVAANMSWSNQDISELVKSKKGLILLYTLYANFTAIFPLLGILGTVAALVTYESSEDMMKNLMVALTTTLAGVLAAIIFKVCDSFVSGDIDILVGEIDYISQNTDIKEEISDEI